MAIATVAKPRKAVTKKTQLLNDRSTAAGDEYKHKSVRLFQKIEGLDWNL